MTISSSNSSDSTTNSHATATSVDSKPFVMTLRESRSLCGMGATCEKGAAGACHQRRNKTDGGLVAAIRDSLKARLLQLALSCCSLVPAMAFAEDVTILTSFPGSSGPGPKDNPDNTGGVGPGHVVDCTDANIVIHDKKTGRVLERMTQTEFWKSARPGFTLPVLNDPRMSYDPLSGRWYTVAQAQDATPYGFLAVSESMDPTKGWRGVQLPMKPANLGMKLGFDKNGIYITFIVMTGNTHTMHGCFAIPKDDAIAAGGPLLANVQSFTDLEIESFPATDINPNKSAGAPELILNSEFGNSFSRMYLYKLTWSGKTATLSKAQIIPLSRTYQSPNGASLLGRAVQPDPGGKLRADEARRTTCVYAHGGSIFSCNAAKKTLDSRCGVFWCEIRASDGKVLQEGFVDAPDCDYLAPSLAVDANGNIGLGCTRTSETEFPSACVMMHAAGDPRNTMRPPVVAAKGSTVFSSNRPSNYGLAWGNYNITCVDPSDPTILWTYQEYATSNVPSQYTTCWVAFKLR